MNKQKPIFIPPQFPFKWIFATFALPFSTFFIPYFANYAKRDVKLLLIIALSVAVLMLFLTCIALILKLYSAEFANQLINIDLTHTANAISKNIEDVEKEMQEIRKDMQFLRSIISREKPIV